MKTKLFALAVILATMFGGSDAISQNLFRRSIIKSGDKDQAAVEASYKIMTKQVAVYQKEIESLRERNDKILSELINDSLRVIPDRLKAEIEQNDKLIISYFSKIDNLETQIDGLLILTAAQAKERRADLRSSSPQDVAEADIMLAYADRIRAGSSLQNAKTPTVGAISEGVSSKNLVNLVDSTSTADKMLLINEWHKDVVVKIKGPANFYQEATLAKKARLELAPTAPLVPGMYIIEFALSGEASVVYKKVGPLTHYQSNGKEYALMATLQAY